MLSPDYGRLSALARGAFRKGSAFAGLLEPFALCEFVLSIKKTREVQNLTGCSLIEYYNGIRKDGRRIAGAEAAVELVRKTVPEGAPVPGVFELLRAYLKRLNECGGISVSEMERWVNRFMLHYLKIMGFAPVFHSCVRCGTTALSFPVRLSPLAGGPVCRDCTREGTDGRLVSLGVLAALDALFRRPAEALQDSAWEFREVLGEVVLEFMRTHFEKDMRLNSLEVLYQS